MAGLGRPGPGPRAALPAWKREVLERKRAKLAALGGGAAERTGAAEPCVLAESLGPLRENPFMRLESERRRGAAGLQKTGSNSFTVHPRGLHRGAGVRALPNGPAAPGPRAGPANGLAGSPPGPGEWKPKAESGEPSLHAPPSPGTPSATPTAPTTFPELRPASATPSQRQWVSAATSANDSFEIRPAPKPDMETVPSGDLQARALASLRANSRNSFVFIPKRKACGAPSPEGRQSGELQQGEVGWASQSQRLGAQLVPGGDGAPALGKSSLGIEEQGCPRPAIALTDRAIRRQRSSSPPPFLPATDEAEPAEGCRGLGLAKNGREHGRPGLPVTLIDEVDSEEEAPQEAKLPCSGGGVPPQYRPHPARPGHTSELQHRGNNTFTVVPKRRPEALRGQHPGQAGGEPPPQEAKEEEAGFLSGPQAALGSTLKKRYPTVHEIEVIGGYLALQKSCLTKAGSSRKKMKISFNDKSLQTTFEYPSESSLVQEEEEEEEEGEGGEEEEDDEEEEVESSSEEKPFVLFLPRATFVSGVGPESPRLPEGNAGLSSYTPKHSVVFGKWQEKTPEQTPSEAEPPPKELTLTPASQNDLADFCSEPALHF
ncbi:PREDICTED: taperin [Propithecus coquereli]|uniref:taperin n=1 Tax=Propithecus coquereli TaxID=379532 RepID=UPI00063F0409|nr:PREDICTED: taperin [Propithecus coquereli]